VFDVYSDVFDACFDVFEVVFDVRLVLDLRLGLFYFSLVTWAKPQRM